MPSVMGLPWQGREGTKPQDRGAGKTNGGSVTYRTCIWQKTSWHHLSLVSEGGHQPYFARTLSGSFASKLVRFPAQQSPPSIHLGISSTSLSPQSGKSSQLTLIIESLMLCWELHLPVERSLRLPPGNYRVFFSSVATFCILIATASCARS